MSLTPKAVIEYDSADDWYTVWAVWEGEKVDRPRSYAIVARKFPLAQRLARAIDAGAVFSDPVINTDIEGNTYVHARSKVMAKYLNADLKRLGY